jgi:glycopeptide antibiotics resistance protein
VRTVFGAFDDVASAVLVPLLVVMFVLAVGVLVRRRRGTVGRRVVAVAGGTIVGLSLTAIALATLQPLGASEWPAGVNLTPLETVHLYLAPGVSTLLAVQNLVLNVVLFVPLGIGMVLLRGRGVAVATVTGIVVSLVVEALQFVLPLGRSVDVDDVLLNSAGALLGAVAAVAARRWAAAGHAVVTESPTMEAV